MKEFYITEGKNQQHAFSNCHIVGELRALNENITCSVLATILDLFKIILIYLVFYKYVSF